MIFLLLYLINLYIRPQDWVEMFYAWPVDYLIIIPALIVAFLSSTADKHKLSKIPQYTLLIGLLVIIFLSNAINGEIVFGWGEFILFLKKVCIFIMVLLMIKSTNKLKWTMFFMVLLSSFIAYQAIQQFYSGGLGLAGQDFYHSGTGIRTRWVGLWNGANIMALLLNISVPFALEFVFGPYPVIFRITNVILTACLIGGIYTSNSRGGFVTLLAILFLYPLIKLKKKKFAIIVGILLALAALLYLAPSRANEISEKEESAHIRTRLWSNAMEKFTISPLIGIGKGRFKLTTSRHLVAHSNFMQNLAEIGAIGIFVWVALVYFSFKGLFFIYKTTPSPGTREYALKSLSQALLVSMVGFNICTLFITMEIDIFYLLLGLCAAAFNVMSREIKPMQMKFTLKDARNIVIIIFGMSAFYQFYIRL